MKAKVTVGMCVKNCEATVKGAIDSVVNQDYPHKLMEIIVVDGNSTDKTLDIIKSSVSRTKIQVRVFCDEGKGLAAARQIVVDNAGGEYIAWVDGDWLLPKNYLREQVDYMEQDPKLGAARGTWGWSKGRTLIAALEALDYGFGRGEDARGALRSLGCAGSIYRVKAIRQVGGFDKRIFFGAEDRDATARIRAAGWLLSLSQVKIYQRFRETWKDLWNKHAWWGYGAHYINHKHKLSNVLTYPFYWIPPVTFMVGLRRSFKAYKLSYQKISFLLPFHNFLKAIAWCFGFVKGHTDGYGHEFRKR